MTIYYKCGVIRPTRYGTFRAEVNHRKQRYRKALKTEAQARA